MKVKALSNFRPFCLLLYNLIRLDSDICKTLLLFHATACHFNRKREGREGFREKMTKRDIGGREGEGKKCRFLSAVLFE